MQVCNKGQLSVCEQTGIVGMHFNMAAKQSERNTEEKKDKLLLKQEAADFLRITPRCLEEWMAQGIIPFYKLGKRAVRFKQSDMEAHLEANFKITNGASR